MLSLPVSPARVRLGSHTVWLALHAGCSPGAAPLQSGRHAGVLMVRAPIVLAVLPRRTGVASRTDVTQRCNAGNPDDRSSG